MKLCTNFSNEEIGVLNKRIGDNYEIMHHCIGFHYELNYYGNLKYEDCFGKINNEIISNQKYNQISPYRMIKISDFYIIECLEYRGEFLRGRELLSGKFEYDVYGESLDEILDTL